MTLPIPSFHEWMARDEARRGATWLILGKGPSFARLHDLDTGAMLRFGLNHVVSQTRVDVFHCIDIEVVEHCREAIEVNAGIAVLPWAPHVRRRLVPFSSYREFLPSGVSLADYLAHFPVLRRLAEQERLFWYNLRTAPRRLRRPEAPITPARGFSASAATALLADCGVRRIRTLGIDGGARYAGSFADLTDKTLLAGGQGSFDSQFTAIAGLIQDYALDLGPLDQTLPARIRIETAPGEDLPARVLAHGLRRYASLSLDIEQVPRPGAETAPVEPGKTLRIGATCLARADLRALWTLPEAELPATTSADAGPLLHLVDDRDSIGARRLAPPPAWRAQDAALQAHSPVICWAGDQPTPWTRLGAPGEVAWCETLLDAVRRGAINRAAVERAVATGETRRSLLAQLARGIADPALLPQRERVADSAAPDPRYTAARRWSARTRALTLRLGWPTWRRYGLLILDKGAKVMRELGNDGRDTG